MIKELIKIANELDHKGLTKEADALDEIIKNALDADPATEAYLIYGAFHELWEDAHKLLNHNAKELDSLAGQWQKMREDRWLEKVSYSTEYWNDNMNQLYLISKATERRLRSLIQKLGLNHDLVKGELGLEAVYRKQLRMVTTSIASVFDEDDRADLLSLSEIIKNLPEDQLADINLWTENPLVKEFLLKSTVYPYREWEGYSALSDYLIKELKSVVPDMEKVYNMAATVDSNLRTAVRDLRKLDTDKDLSEYLEDD